MAKEADTPWQLEAVKGWKVGMWARRRMEEGGVAGMGLAVRQGSGKATGRPTGRGGRTAHLFGPTRHHFRTFI